MAGDKKVSHLVYQKRFESSTLVVQGGGIKRLEEQMKTQRQLFRVRHVVKLAARLD